MKGTKGERQEIHNIQAEILQKGLYYCIVGVKKSRYQTNILHKREDKSYIWVHYQSNLDLI